MIDTLTGGQVVAAVAAGAVVGYGLGSINPASLIARARGVNLRDVGSGNPGATNVSRALGRKVGALVLVLDLAKGAVPVLIFTLADIPLAAAVAGLAAVLGHMTSPFLRGHGGKGVATTLGVILVAEPLWLIPILVAFVVVRWLSHRTGIASVAGAVALIVIAAWDRNQPEYSWMGVIIGILVIVRHASNIRAAIHDFRTRNDDTWGT